MARAGGGSEKRKRVERGEREDAGVGGEAETSARSGVAGQASRDFEIEGLPEDILFAIVDQLDGKDLASLIMACKSWGRVANQDILWKMVTSKHESWANAIGRGRPHYSWKKIFVTLYCLEHNMCKNCFKRSKVTHVCKENMEKELSNPIYNPSLCSFFPGLHAMRSDNSRQNVSGVETNL